MILKLLVPTICLVLSAAVVGKHEQNVQNFQKIKSFHLSADRIVGGHEAKIEDFPWQVSIIDMNGHFCGGIIIDKRRILTAAHCIRRGNNPDYEHFIRIRAGSSNRKSGGALRAVTKVVIHQNFNDDTFDNDIAMIFLKYPLVWSASTQPIALPRRNESIAANTTVVVSGWGYRMTEDEDDLPIILNAVEIPIVDREDCEKAYEQLTENMICAGLLNVGGKDSCQVCKKYFYFII